MEGTPPRTFALLSTKTTPTGILLNHYKVVGPLKTGCSTTRHRLSIPNAVEVRWERDMSDRNEVSAATGVSLATIAGRLERLPLTAYQRTLFLIIATAWFFDSIDLGSLTFVLGSIRSEFGLSAPQTGLLSGMSFVGMFFGAAIAGMAADRYGRTLVFQVSMIFWGLGGLACGLAPSVTALGAARALLGFGMGMEFPVAQSIVSEIIPARLRGRYLALLEGFWPLGFIVAGLIAHAVLPISGWRRVFLIEAAPAVLVFAVRFLVPESPRWLAVRGRLAAADEVTQKFERAVSARLHGAALPEPRPSRLRGRQVRDSRSWNSGPPDTSGGR